MLRSAALLALTLVAAHTAGCGARDQGTSSADASVDGAGNGSGDGGGNALSDDAGAGVTDDGATGVGSDAGQGSGNGAVFDAGDGGEPASFPLGAYDDCTLTTFLQTPGGGGMTAFGRSVTLTQSASALTVTSAADGGVLDAPLTFTPTSGLSASLDPGQQVGGVQLSCAPLEFAPSVVQLGSGSLTYDEGTLFLSVIGTAGPIDAGGGCSNPGGQVALAITCSGSPASQSQAAAIDAGSSDAGQGSDFVGVYTCSSSVLSSSSHLESVAGGSAGTMTITETAGVLTAAYANDLYAQGSLAFEATSAEAALPATTGETMQVYCVDSTLPPPPGNPPLTVMPVRGSTLTIDGSSLVVSFAGTMPAGSSCAGAATTVSVLCAK